MQATASKLWVDTHFHVFQAGGAVDGARYVPAYDAHLRDWRERAARVGIARGVCVQPSFLGDDNRALLQALRSHPQALRGIAVVKPDVGAPVLSELHAAGVRGIRLNLSGVCHDLAAWTQADALWAALHDMGWHIEVHTDPGRLPHALRQLPTDLPLVVDHMAKPMQASPHDPTVQALCQRAARTPVHIKLSGAYRLGGVNPAELAALWLNELGATALLWGSDWPCTNHESFADLGQLMAQAHEWIPPEHLEQVLTINPHQLYWLPLSEPADISSEAPMTPDSFDTFQTHKLREGYDEVLLREWAPDFSNAPHSHPFDTDALVVQGEFWLTVDGRTAHYRAGDRFQVARGVLHAERYGPQGAVFWAARKN